MPIEAINYYRSCCNQLEGIYPRSEAQSMVRLLLEKVTGISVHKILASKDFQIFNLQMEMLDQYLSQLKLQKPIQYILGEAHFFDLTFRVTPDVLIPRPETEELVKWILQDGSKSKKKILDIGTGSGCIAISLSKNRPEWEVYATDISNRALKIASDNATQLDAEVAFLKQDILSGTTELTNIGPFDIIVSNPPYIRESEKRRMQANVLEHEPEQALFVTDADPLLFYRAIAEASKDILKEDGAVFFEINEALNIQTSNLLKDLGFPYIETRKDIHGKDRMIMAKRE